VDINSTVGRRAGLTDEKLQAVSGTDLSVFNDLERLVIALADALSDTPSNVPDSLYARLRELFSEKQLIELGAQLPSSSTGRGSIACSMSAAMSCITPVNEWHGRGSRRGWGSAVSVVRRFGN